MKNARNSFTKKIRAVMEANAAVFGVFSLRTGNEADPKLVIPGVSLTYLDRDSQSRKRPEGRVMLVQVDVIVANANEAEGDAACMALLDGLGIRKGSQPCGIVPKFAYSVVGGVVQATALGTTLIIQKQSGKGWKQGPSKQQRDRVYTITLEVDFIPDP